jgi:hypothetical protein
MIAQRIRRPALVLLPLLLLTTGCISIGSTTKGNPIPTEVLQQIVKGKTTRAQVLEWLGAPKEVESAEVTNLAESALSRYGGEQLTLKLDPALFNDVYIYERTESNYFIVALILFNYYRSDERSDRLAVFFDKEGKVLGVGWTPGRDGL